MSEISIKSVCCTCLSTDRKLYQLCRILDGINLLYMLLSLDPEAYKAGFYKDMASLSVCWECKATIHRIRRFQKHACVAQKHLASLADGRNHVKLHTFTRLSCSHNVTPHYEFQSEDVPENFIDCGPVKEIKTESDSDDMPLSAFCFDNNSDDELGSCTFEAGISLECESVELGKDIANPDNDVTKPGKKFAKHGKNITNPGKVTAPDNINMTINSESPTFLEQNTKFIQKSSVPGNTINNIEATENLNTKKKAKIKYSKYFSKSTMDEKSRLLNAEQRKVNLSAAVFKCDNCLLEFKTENEIINHDMNFHRKKDNCSLCDICHSYVEDLHTHRQIHYQCYSCVLCTHIADTHMEIVSHLKRQHKDICCGKNKGSKRKRNGRLEEFLKYPCPECELSYLNKDLRWKHIQKVHREGYKCRICGKQFAFKNNLERHERIHNGPLPREECPSCHKMIRIDLVKVHSRIHTDRQTHSCVECDKSFVSRATYESHLKYAQAHATADVCRHKCPSCHKRYRSRGELRDHVNYHHNGQAEHKCPICGKGLATKRCIRRHVRRAHEGIKESAKDKICQQCGKAFRDKKGLIEHERVHTGARPLACASCGRAFRQRAALHAHTRRLHRTTTIS